MVLGALFAVFVTGCGRGQQTEVRLALNPWPGTEFLYLAKEKGFLTDEKLNVRLVEYPSLSDCRVAFESGHADAMACTPIEVLLARENAQRSSQIVLVADYSDGADVILARSDLASVPALRGHRVGLELGSLGAFMLDRALNSHGLKLSDVEMVSCAQDSMEAALAAGTVDAIVTYPPTSVRLEAGGKVRRVFTSAEIPGEIVDVVAVDPAILLREPELQARLRRAFQRALDYAREHPQEAYALMGRREGISAAEFQQALVGIRVVDAAGQDVFFNPKGSLLHSLGHVDNTLRMAGQLRGNKALAELLPPAVPATAK